MADYGSEFWVVVLPVVVTTVGGVIVAIVGKWRNRAGSAVESEPIPVRPTPELTHMVKSLENSIQRLTPLEGELKALADRTREIDRVRDRVAILEHDFEKAADVRSDTNKVAHDAKHAAVNALAVLRVIGAKVLDTEEQERLFRETGVKRYE